MNLVNDFWIPVVHKSGKRKRVAPWQIVEQEDPVLFLNTGRPDFDGALTQFLIGLLQTSMTPKDHKEWEKWLDDPPLPNVLKQRLNEKYVSAFDVQGSNSSFMEDFDELEDGSPCGISQILIDSPGEKTWKENTDHFIKRGRVKGLCPSCAVTALFTFQINAPQGGRGHLTSLRGGGPLTTLIILDERNTDLPNDLWRNIWINVLEAEEVIQDKDKEKSRPVDIFPWLGATRTGQKQKTTPMDAHSLQMYWGMPRRIRIDWKNVESGQCDLCNELSHHLVKKYKTKTYGTNYKGSWQHPLTPYKRNEDGTIFSLKAQPGGLTYQHWVDYMGNGQSTSASRVVKKYLESRKLSEEQIRLYAFGFDMDKMKARCWYETKFPIFFNISDEESMKEIVLLIETAEKCNSTLFECIKDAWTMSKNTKGDISFLKKEFYHKTEKMFYDTVKIIATEENHDAFESWYNHLKKVALNIFSFWAIQGDFTNLDVKAISKSREKLYKGLNSIKRKLHLEIK